MQENLFLKFFNAIINTRIMNNQTNVFEDLFSTTADYLETKGELLQLKAVDKSSGIVSSFVSGIVISIVCCIVLIMLSIGASIWLGDILGSLYIGFFAVAGFYLLVLLILYIGRNSLLKIPVENFFVKKLLN